MEIAGFIVALIALVVSLGLALHTLSTGPKLKAEAAVRYKFEGGRYVVTGVQLTIYNLGRGSLPVRGVGVGGQHPRTLSWSDPSRSAADSEVSRNPAFPLALPPGGAVNVVLVRDLEPGKFLRIRYFKRRWWLGPLHEVGWDKPITEKMVLGHSDPPASKTA